MDLTNPKELQISASPIWVKKDPDGTKCRHCGDQLLVAKNVLAIQTEVSGSIETAETKYAICNPCLELFENE